MKFTALLLLLNLFIYSSAQEVALTLPEISLLGAKQVEDKLILLSLSEKNMLALTAIDEHAKQLWQTELEVKNLGGYNFNQLYVVGDKKYIYLVRELPEETKITQFDALTGTILTNDVHKQGDSDDSNIWALGKNELINLKIKGNELQKVAQSTPLFTLPKRYPEDKFKVHFSHNNQAYVSSRVLEPNHGLMHLYIAKVDLTSGDTIQREIDLELAYTSFTYSSSVDKNIFGVVQCPTGFYLVGKLDIAFKNKYPTAKVGDNCIGLWVAKFDYDLELVYFDEIPFQYLDHIVPADVINKPAIIDLKEDANGGVFINVNELQGVIYGQKYFIYLEADGNIGMAKGGKDEYQFMEYDQMGLRDAGRKNRLRLINDDWPSYATNSYLYLTPKPKMYSLQANILLDISNKSNASRDGKSYNYVELNGKNLYLEYLARKRGTLNIWVD
jgi:hypothetical protein